MLQVKSFAFNPFQENTYIVYNDNKNAFIIDPGNISEHETAALKNFIDENGLTVKNILLTHAHIDHVLGLQWAHDTYKVPVLMHLHEKELLDMNPITARNYGFFFKPFEGEIQHIRENDTLSLDDQPLE
ncbi:MAG: MBL fold metallo-hydrolase, partial [Chryseobacterium sp.]